MITDEKILVTGVSGTVAGPLARRLAPHNEVWGLARFVGDAERADEAFDEASTPERRGLSGREALEAAGVHTIAADLGVSDLTHVPDDFTLVLHLAWMRGDAAHLDAAIRTNVEGAGMVLHHCRRAKRALVMSGQGVYAPDDDPWHRYRETDPIGRAATAYAPTSPACKLGVEAVARFCARAFDLPVTIARLGTFNGAPTSLPGIVISNVLAGEEVVVPWDPSLHNPIHVDDMAWQIEPLLDAASRTPLIVNWAGDDVTSVQRWVEDVSEWSGREGRVRTSPVPCSPRGAIADTERRESITGRCRTTFPESFRALYDAMSEGRGDT